MIVKEHYRKYLITHKGFTVGVKIGEDKITLQNKGAGYNHWLKNSLPNYEAWDSTYVFKHSTPETIETFAKILAQVVRLQKTAPKGEK